MIAHPEDNGFQRSRPPSRIRNSDTYAGVGFAGPSVAANRDTGYQPNEESLSSQRLRDARVDCRGNRRGGDKIGRRKCFSFPFVIRRRIGRNCRVRRPVNRIAVQVAGVFD